MRYKIVLSGLVKKTCWVIIVVACMAAVVYNSTVVMLSFIQYDVNVDVSVIRNAELPFPAVTICNLTPINRYVI